jgi:PAS domain-containing protein
MVDLRRILERLPVAVWVGQVPGGDVTNANPEFQSILGMDAVPGTDIEAAPVTYGIFDRTGSPCPVDKLPYSRVVATRQATMVDDIVIHRMDGRKVNVRAFAYPVFSGDDLTHVVVAFVDITQEVKAEVEREQTEARLALAVHHAPIVIWSGGCQWRGDIVSGVWSIVAGAKFGDRPQFLVVQKLGSVPESIFRRSFSLNTRTPGRETRTSMFLSRESWERSAG